MKMKARQHSKNVPISETVKIKQPATCKERITPTRISLRSILVNTAYIMLLGYHGLGLLSSFLPSTEWHNNNKVGACSREYPRTIHFDQFPNQVAQHGGLVFLHSFLPSANPKTCQGRSNEQKFENKLNQIVLCIVENRPPNQVAKQTLES